ncbi:DUF1624 domain-containing protein [Pseudolysobacter antarcticus]|uniref:DUF1624 domain-containing protein n=1 Tax=Pseudolysobacter antarcticus TaxID=2511995 RepID=A0A411HQH9_9GAMM|nr:heparan-alpha-glucosaminide N-acetyltransferase domain-containing protein [Pseudolysobacter antarcticus]QBB72680.1 DUF1624 domain-containing protein [Pseudolysobacter antarcticus]
MRRYASVDALRGLTVAAMLLVNDPGDWAHVYAPLEHAEWNGCTFADFIFPFFLFIVGVSIALSLSPRVLAGADTAALRRAVLWRALRIFALGLLLNVIAHWCIDQRDLRFMGVLQRIGLCYAAAGLAAIYLKPRTQWLLFGVLLLGYWALLAWAGPLTFDGNLVARIDTLVLGSTAYLYDTTSGQAHDPEGLLSTFPAIATTLLGMRAGMWLREKNLQRLVDFGVVAMLVGLVWAMIFPFNKQLWTSSFVLWTGGAALLLLALMHWLIDRRGWQAIGRSFGSNAIAAYAGAWLMVCLFELLHVSQPLYRFLFADWMTPYFGAYLPSLSYAIAITTIWWLLMWCCDRRGWHLKI